MDILEKIEKISRLLGECEAEKKGRLDMKSIYVLMIGIPLAAAIATATSLPILFAVEALFLWALWLAAGQAQRA
jgi:hypothetical protein